MTTLFARLIPPSVSPTFALARHASTPAQCLCRPGHAPADQDHSKIVSAHRAAEERVSTRCVVLTFVRSVWTTLTGTGPPLGQRFKASLADRGRYDLDRRSGSRAQGVRTLFLVAALLAASPFDAAAVELINPHDVLNQTRRDLNELTSVGSGTRRSNRSKRKKQRPNVSRTRLSGRSERRRRRPCKRPNGNVRLPSNRHERERRRGERRDKSRTRLSDKNGR